VDATLQSLPAPSPKLLDQVKDLAITRGHSEQTAQSFVDWNRRFVLFHNKRHPKEMGLGDIARYLEHVVKTEKELLVALEAGQMALVGKRGED
jgi:hypothetical protein